LGARYPAVLQACTRQRSTTGPAAGAPAPARIRGVLIPESALDRLQRVAQREPLGVLDEPPFTVVPMHAAGKRLPGHGVVLDEHFELQARPEDRGDDLTQPMAPLPELVVAKLDFGVHVRFGLVEMPRFRLLEIRVAQHPFVCPLVIEGQQNRMSLTQEKPATGAQQFRDGPCPSPNSGSQPSAPIPVKTKSN